VVPDDPANPSGRRRRSWPAPLAAAVLVAAGATGIVLLTRDAGASTDPVAHVTGTASPGVSPTSGVGAGPGMVVTAPTEQPRSAIPWGQVGPGEAFGEMAMLADDHRRTSTIVAIEPVITLSLRFEEFRRLCEEHPEVNDLLVRMLAQRVDRLSTHLLDALYLSADGRVLRTLLDLCEQYADWAKSVEVHLPLTQVEVAELSGASRPTANRYLRRLEQGGLIRLQRGQVTVVDVSALRRISAPSSG